MIWLLYVTSVSWSGPVHGKTFAWISIYNASYHILVNNSDVIRINVDDWSVNRYICWFNDWCIFYFLLDVNDCESSCVLVNILVKTEQLLTTRWTNTLVVAFKDTLGSTKKQVLCNMYLIDVVFQSKSNAHNTTQRKQYCK